MATVQEILVVFKNFLDFASIYCLIKCLKAMLCGIAVMPFILFIHRLLKNKLATTSCYVMLLLALMPLMGMSRLFYQKHFAWVTVVLSEYAKVAYGYIYFGVMFALAGVFAIKMFQMKKQMLFGKTAGYLLMMTGRKICLKRWMNWLDYIFPENIILQTNPPIIWRWAILPDRPRIIINLPSVLRNYGMTG